jgi:hypothetical protein
MRYRLLIAGVLTVTTAGCSSLAFTRPAVCHYRGNGLFVEPDPRCTPGALSPAVTQRSIDRTVCRRGGYTASVRPPASVTEPEKRRSMAAYGVRAPMSSVEYDHLVPLSLGGAPDDARNLWPEPDYPHVSPDSYVLNPKDELEGRLRDLVCAGQLGLAAAQRMIAGDWVGAYRRLTR